ncbi:MAG: hypothetical protein ABMA25_02290 [Ilumatobacteraceae bacterium]
MNQPPNAEHRPAKPGDVQSNIDATSTNEIVHRTAEQMTRRDRDELAKVARLRARVAKADVEQREAALRAQVEEELSAVFSVEDERLADLTSMAREAFAKISADILERCRELGIRDEFRPQYHLLWAGRGVNAVPARRAELRALAKTRIEALGKAAKVGIDRSCADIISTLITGGLDSVEAHAFLNTMPTVDSMMRAPSVAELQAATDVDRAERTGRF